MNPNKPVEPPKCRHYTVIPEPGGLEAKCTVCGEVITLRFAKFRQVSERMNLPITPESLDQPHAGKHVESYATGDSHTDSPQKPVSHMMPEEVRNFFEQLLIFGGLTPYEVIPRSFVAVQAAYQRIADLEKTIKMMDEAKDFNCSDLVCEVDRATLETQIKIDEIEELKSQLSTLKAQMKEVIKAGDSVKSQLQQEEPNCFQGMIDNWKYVTAALRQSGQGSTE